MTESQIQQLLELPPPAQLAAHAAQLTAGLGLEVRLDAGGGKGKGIFACQAFHKGQVLFTEAPLAAIQHTTNRPEAWVCAHCLRFIGSIEQQAARLIGAVRQAAQAGAGPEDGAAAAADEEAEVGLNVDAALALQEEELQALDGGQLRLPFSDAVSLRKAVGCRRGCCDEWYCSPACADAAWTQYHQLLCPGPEPQGSDEGDAESSGGGGASKPEGFSVTAVQQHQQQEQADAMREFLLLADATNDIFRLAARVVAQVLLAAERLLLQQWQQAANGSGGSGSSSAAGAGAGPEPSSEACWQALLEAWQPFAAGHKAVWWECEAVPPEAAADMRELAVDSLDALAAALPPRMRRRYPALLTLPVWGSIIGMFELNNLGVYVASPLQLWLNHLDGLEAGTPQQQQQAADAYVTAGRFIEALPEELPGCDGNAFYALHSCCNHSCVPNAEAFKRDEDEDGSAVILALRDIPAGEEVTLSYIDLAAPLAERREALADYGFVCACDKCSAEELAEELLPAVAATAT